MQAFSAFFGFGGSAPALNGSLDGDDVFGGSQDLKMEPARPDESSQAELTHAAWSKARHGDLESLWAQFMSAQEVH